MSTAAVNMFAPDGTVRSVAPDQLQEALKNGGEVAHKFKAPDGTMRFVPTSKFAQALKNGGIPAQADQSQPTQFEKDNLSTGAISKVQGDISTASGKPSPVSNLNPTQFEIDNNSWNPLSEASETRNAISKARGPEVVARQQANKAAAGQYFSSPGFAEAAVNNLTGTGLGTVGAGVSNVAQGNVARGSHQVISGGLDTVSPLLPSALAKAPLTTSLAVLFGAGGSAAGSAGAKLLGANQDQQNLTGDITGLLAGGAGAKLGSLSEFARPLVKAQTVEKITNAVNPAPEDAPKLRADLHEHLDTVVNYAKDNSLPLNSVSDFAKAASGAGKSAHDFYMQKMVAPIEQDSIPVPAQSQVGRQVGEYSGNRQATVGEITKRLATINDTLYPKYQKGGLAAQAAVGADPQALASEGAALRDTLNAYMSKKLDIPIEQVAAIRKQMGTLRQMGEDVQYSADKTNHGINAIDNNPIRSDAKIPAYALQKGQVAFRRAYGTPADKSLSGAIARYNPGSSGNPNPTVLERNTPPTRSPEWLNRGTQPTSPSDFTGGISTVDPAQQLDQMLGNRIHRTNQAALVRREAAQAAELNRAKNKAQHGNYF